MTRKKKPRTLPKKKYTFQLSISFARWSISTWIFHAKKWNMIRTRVSCVAPTIHIVVITVWEAKHYTIFVLRRHWAGRNRKLVPAPRFMGPSKRKRIPRNFHTPPFPGLCRVFGKNHPPPPAEECSRFTERADALKAERKEVSRQVE